VGWTWLYRWYLGLTVKNLCPNRLMMEDDCCQKN